jgi:hypothetical protein
VLRYPRQIFKRAVRDTSQWATSKLAEKVVVALAAFTGTSVATALFVGVGADALRVSLASGLLSLFALVVLQFIFAIVGAPSKVRADNTRRPGESADLVIRVGPKIPPDQLQHDAVYALRKIGEYKDVRRLLGKGPNNELTADKKLAHVNAEIESFGKRAARLGSDVISRRGRREALELYQEIFPVTHTTDLDALIRRINWYAYGRLRWIERLRLQLAYRWR